MPFFRTFRTQWIHVNLNDLAKILAPMDVVENPFLDAQWVDNLLGAMQLPNNVHTCTYGGFLEDRSHLWRGHYFKKGPVHLGVDFNVPKNVAVTLPCDGTLVESFQDPDQNGGWGGKVTYDCDGFFLTFAHLKEIPPEYRIGDKFLAGDGVGFTAAQTQNGGWFEHLHVQASRTFDPNRDGYVEELYDGIEEDFFDPIEIVNRKRICKNCN